MGNKFLEFHLNFAYLTKCFDLKFEMKIHRERSRLRHYYQSRQQVMVALGLLLLLPILGALGYSAVEGWSFLDAIYMTVITLSTVGYGEIQPLSTPGRIYTILLIVISFGIVGYGVTNLVSFIMEGELRKIIQGKKMDKRIAKMSNHIIVCGGGNTGRYVAEELIKTETEFIILERELAVIEALGELGEIHYIHGDATEDTTLKLAGIERAKGLISALNDDKENTFVVLSARSLNPNLRIVARNIDESNIGKLEKAGADHVLTPNAIGGFRMASLMIRPSLIQFFDAMLNDRNAIIRLEDLKVDNFKSLIGSTILESDIRSKTGLLIIAIKHIQGEFEFNPKPHTVIRTGDVLLVLGTREQYGKFHREYHS